MDMIEALYDDNLINKERQSDGRFRYALLASIQAYTAHKFKELQNKDASIKTCSPATRSNITEIYLIQKRRVYDRQCIRSRVG